jgi:hypothetical protein
MRVIAAPGTRCPMERNHREYITDTEAVDVPETTYYSRLIADGSLRVAPEPAKEKEGGRK